MNAVVTDTADAVVVQLNGTGFSLPFTATRRYRPRYELKDLTGLTVTVVPRSVTINATTRTTHSIDATVDVAVQQRLLPPEGKSDAAIDPLMALVQELVDFLSVRRLVGLVGGQEAVWVGTTNEPVYAVEHLDELRLFTSVITITYRAPGTPGSVP